MFIAIYALECEIYFTVSYYYIRVNTFLQQ